MVLKCIHKQGWGKTRIHTHIQSSVRLPSLVQSARSCETECEQEQQRLQRASNSCCCVRRGCEVGGVWKGKARKGREERDEYIMEPCITIAWDILGSSATYASPLYAKPDRVFVVIFDPAFLWGHNLHSSPLKCVCYTLFVQVPQLRTSLLSLYTTLSMHK